MFASLLTFVAARRVIMLAAVTVVLKTTDMLEKRGVRRDEQNLARLLAELLFSIVLSIWPPVLVLCFGNQFNGTHLLSARAFIAWWAWLALGMFTFSAVISLLLRTLGEAGGMAAHAVLLVISLVSSSAVEPVELMSPFFRIGIALPFANSLRGSRTIVFGSYNRIGQNFGVLAAWLTVTMLLTWRRHRKYSRELEHTQPPQRDDSAILKAAPWAVAPLPTRRAALLRMSDGA
jgi:hypothetical protein